MPKMKVLAPDGTVRLELDMTAMNKVTRLVAEALSDSGVLDTCSMMAALASIVHANASRAGVDPIKFMQVMDEVIQQENALGTTTHESVKIKLPS